MAMQMPEYQRVYMAGLKDHKTPKQAARAVLEQFASVDMVADLDAPTGGGKFLAACRRRDLVAALRVADDVNAVLVPYYVIYFGRSHGLAGTPTSSS